MKEFKIWLKYSGYSFQQFLINRPIVIVFLTAKIFRIGLFLVFLNFLLLGTNALGGYSREQVIFFYLSFNLIDTLSQFFFREVYRFRPLIVSGGLDFVLVKPLNPLIRVLLGGADVIDFVMLFLLLTITIWYGTAHITTSLFSWFLYLLLVINGFIIAAAFHILVLCLGILTTSVDHLIMIYRDLSSMLRIPADLYVEPIRFLLTFAIPLGVMITFPSKILMNLLSPFEIAISLLVSFIALYLSLAFWHYSLKQYQSASS